MAKILETKYIMYSYVIDAKDYLAFKDILNKELKTILKISPTHVAGKTSDGFVIYAANLEKKTQKYLEVTP